MAIRFFNKLQSIFAHAEKSANSLSLILFSSAASFYTTKHTSNQLVQEGSPKTTPGYKQLSTKNASLEVVPRESTVGDTQSPKAGDPPVEATAGESVVLVKDKKTLVRTGVNS